MSKNETNEWLWLELQLHRNMSKKKMRIEQNKIIYNEIKSFVDYEIRSSWWVGLIFWEKGQNLAASYFIWKTKRKYYRFKSSKINNR